MFYILLILYILGLWNVKGNINILLTLRVSLSPKTA